MQVVPIAGKTLVIWYFFSRFFSIGTGYCFNTNLSKLIK